MSRSLFARSLVGACVSGLVALIGFSLSGAAQSPAPNPFQQLRFRHIGPPGNRAIAVAGEPGNPLVVYVGAASGGIFKTSDGGNSWQPIFDDQDISSIGSLALAPSAPNIVWAGTGETFLIRPAHAMGNGIYRSDDAGKTWKHMGLEKTGRIGRVVVHPQDSDIVFACALGHSYGPQPERGVYRTKDGGKTWEQVLKVDENTGCADIAIDPNDPQTLFAGMWQLEIKTWKLNSGGPGSGVYVSRDGGSTWKKLVGNGLPAADHPVGKVGVAVSKSRPGLVFALIQDATPGLYRSQDHGETWKLVQEDHILAERSPYYVRFAIAPDNENVLYFASVAWSASIDGGRSLDPTATAAGGDNHDIWIDPLDSRRIMVANDGGVSISLDRGRTYERVRLPIAQMYHVATDNQIPYYVYGNRQDGPTMRGPSNSLMVGGAGEGPGGIVAGLWRHVGGCETGFAIPDPADNNIVWGGCYDGQLDRFDLRTNVARSVDVWPEATYGWAPADVKERWHWNFPMAISPHDHNRVYAGSQRVHMTADGGQSWAPISPDLTLNDKSHQQNSGGITTDNLMTWDGAVLYSIIESPVEKGLIWVGTNDGQVQLTRDGGKTWTNLTATIKGMPPWGTIKNIEASKYDAGTAYISVDLHQVANFDPYIYKTADYGKTWTLISGGIPKSESSYVNCVREDPVRKGMLYAGTDNALYVSWDDGGKWTRLRNNLPPAPVYWLTIQPQFNDLVIGTYGRGFWILDDITPLREWDKVQATDVQLFAPRPAYRFRRVENIESDTRSPSTGENPPYGADINYVLKSAGSEPATITILGPNNETIRTLKGTSAAGINRVWWDLKYEPEREVRLRTAPPGMPWVKLNAEGWRPLVSWRRAHIQPVAAPGKYTVNVKAGGKELTQPLTILKDPNAPGTEQEIKAQVALLIDLRDKASETADMINRIEWTRKQLEVVMAMLQDDPKGATVLKAAKELEKKTIAAENNLEDVNLTGRSEDSFRAPMGLYSRLISIGMNLVKGGDLPPTNQQNEVSEEFTKRLVSYRAQFKTTIDTDLANFNALLKSNGYGMAVHP
ncbi:MAG: WD40/YVTN/BNR-like repeat-containing protein [Tepidisphaerales bacterium]